MDALIFLLDFPYINEFLADYKEYYKIVVVDRKRKIDMTTLHRYYDEIHFVSNIQCKNEMEKTLARILKTKPIKAIYAPYETVVEMAGYLRQIFNIPGMNYAESIAVRNKYIMKQTAKKHRIATAEITLAKHLTDVNLFIKKYGYPFILKPVSGAATRYTYKISALSDLLDFRVLKMMFRHAEFLIESFIVGKEYHCDSVVSNGNIVFSSVGENLHNNIDTVLYGMPKGSIAFPAYCDSMKTIQDIKSFSKRVIRSFGIKNAVCHMEVFVNHQGTIYLGEIAARIGGSPVIGACIKNTRGLDINKAFIDVAINKYSEYNGQERPVFTGYMAFPSKKGTIVHISNENDFTHISGLKELHFYNQPGDRIMTQTNTSVRTGYVIIEDADYNCLKQKLLAVFKNFNLTVK